MNFDLKLHIIIGLVSVVLPHKPQSIHTRNVFPGTAITNKHKFQLITSLAFLRFQI